MIFGRLLNNGSISGARFGITSHTQVSELELKNGLYIWLSKTAFEELHNFNFLEISDFRSWRGQHFILPSIPLAVKIDNGWFLRNLSDADVATKTLQELTQFSITEPEVLDHLGIQNPATPLILNSE